MNKEVKKLISIFLIELIIVLPIAIAQSLTGPGIFVNAEVPRYSKTKTINIEGESTGLARINMYINNQIPRTLNAEPNGNFLFKDVVLNEGDNTIRFKAESQGKTTEKSYSITADTTPPTITIDEIPNFVGEQKITINGSVSEQVTISFYVTTGEEDITPPPKVTNLRNTTVQANRVELSWDKVNVSDFAQYIVYRNDKPLGIGPDSNYNDYTDVLANSNQTYIYQVAAMDKKGNIGEGSAPLTIKTPEGGRTNLPGEQVNIYENIGGLQKTITTDDKFEEEINIGKEDGFYKIKIEAADIADNKWIYEKEFLLDTEDPEIEIIFPRRNAEIYEQYADMVTIRGQTEPGSRVYLYVQRTPFGIFNKTWDVSGAPDQINQLSEADLRANCRFEVQGKEQCKTHSDYETIADAQGYFEFENVDLTSMFAGAFRITEYPTGEPYYQLVREEELKDFMLSNLFFIAVDPAGRKGVEVADYRIRTCWSSSLTWDATPLIEYQSPTFLNVERLKEGTETIYFYFNFTYHGRGEEGRVTNLYVEKACGKGYLETQDRYDYSCDILRSCTEKLSPKGKTAYVACSLGRLEGIEKWTDDEWDNFIDMIKEEMTFPFKLTLTYNEEYENKTTGHARTHQLCTEIGYVVDAARINPRDVLPDWMLYDFVEVLNESISKLNDWILKIKRILEWTAIGCMVTFFVQFVTQLYRRISCSYDEIFKKISGIVQRAGGEQADDPCRECIQNDNALAEKYDSKENINQDLLSDTCLEACYPSCSSAWKAEESLYKAFRFTCDRVFGHPTPSRWTETVSTDKLYEKATAGTGCANDESVRGKPLRALNCKSLQKHYERIQLSREDTCFELVNMKNKRKYLYTLSETPVDADKYIYEIEKLEGPSEVRSKYVIKQNDNNYLTHQDPTCEEVCKGEGKIPITKIRKVGDDFIFETPQTKEKEGVGTMCVTTNECLSLQDRKYKETKGDKVTEVNSADPVGYTSDCFYGAEETRGMVYTGSLNNPQVVSGDPDLRMECCCINSEGSVSPIDYYEPTDVETKDGEAKGQGSKTNPESLSNMKWSYRYYIMHYKAPSGAIGYDPNRYIEGRDWTACFGQNVWIYDGFKSGSEEGNLLIVDSAKQHLAAFQCVAISQVLNRLVLIKNIMLAMENCLLSIRTTGEADTGICKEIFTQYLCAFVWKIITWIRNGCLPFGRGIDISESENEILKAVGIGTKGIFDSVANSQMMLASEYGNAQLNNLIGVGEEQVFRKICLAAFGYDWEIDADALVDIAYHTPFATLVHPRLLSREYLTFDPTNAQAKYEYRGSWLVNPGCDLDNYEVYLTCVTRNDMYSNGDIDCVKQQDPYGINCDCLDLSPEKAPPPRFYYSSRGKIRQNELIEVDSTQIGGFQRIQTAPYRYDHMMFKLNVDRNYRKNQGDISKCFPNGHEDGIFYSPIRDYTAREIEGCFLDVTTGQFTCKQGASFFYEQGSATIDGVDLNNDGIYEENLLTGDRQKGATFYNNKYIQGKVKYSKDKKRQCLIVRLYNEDGQPFKEPATLAQTKVYRLDSAAEEGVQNFNTGYQVNKKQLESVRPITVTGGQLTQAGTTPQAGLIKWKLYIDIRTPKEDDNCENVKGFEYDNSQIVVVDGIPQSADIPIFLNPNQDGEDQCLGKYSHGPITDECVCGTSDKKNCPEGDKIYCVEDTCRKYPICAGLSTEEEKPCVCDTQIDEMKYDCGYSEASKNDFAGKEQNAKYCEKSQCVEEVTQITSPQTTLQVKIGDFTIDGNLIDDVVQLQKNSPANIEVIIEGATSAQIKVKTETIDLTQTSPGKWTIQWTPNFDGQATVEVSADGESKTRIVNVS